MFHPHFDQIGVFSLFSKSGSGLDGSSLFCVTHGFECLVVVVVVLSVVVVFLREDHLTRDHRCRIERKSLTKAAD